jgi:hypothetical protein
MKPLTGTEILITLLLAVVAIVLLEYSIYIKVKKYGYRITCREALRLQIIALKSALVYAWRLTLLFLVICLPLPGIIILTDSYILLAQYALSFRVPLFFSILPLVLLLADVIATHYFLDKYGALYKLPVVFLIRNETWFLKECPASYIILLIGSITYAITIISLLGTLVSTASMAKIGVGIIIALLLVEVLRNKKYENAINLCEKFEKE